MRNELVAIYLLMLIKFFSGRKINFIWESGPSGRNLYLKLLKNKARVHYTLVTLRQEVRCHERSVESLIL